MNRPDILEQSRRRTAEAHDILDRLRLLRRWRAFGTPVLVGAVAYELTLAPDIDLEIYCDTPDIRDGFSVLRDCAVLDDVRRARFGNHLDDADEGLYWRLDYRAGDGTDWKIDMWALRRDHPGPCAAQLVAPLRAALTPAVRGAILELKYGVRTGAVPRVPSIDIYRAVIDGGVRSGVELTEWLAAHPRDHLTFWMPR
ncbi:hypothetical protein DFR70_11362 [Nocardia tenerifensis]|uniref:Nucleotidyltransferase-like protein n=1 Tax=Nocardia tenerifensis TaxID=228006 RepID=A0A318JXT1_9NOCA|nr:hypothetical protein [Nocardia tenerifensis]PXX58727.1 hypothetical protein DFR70_11362 [Nocardia tenerifensis]